MMGQAQAGDVAPRESNELELDQGAQERLRLERLSSGEFRSNAAFLQIVALAYNLTCALKTLSLPEEYCSLTIKTLRFRLIHMAAMWVRHAR